MAMKLTKHQQEMLDGKLGEAKKFCMEKLADFGEAVDSKEMVDLVLVLNGCPIYVKDRKAPEMKKKLEMYDLGHGPLYDPIFAIKDAHVADETGTQCGNDPYFVQFDKVKEKGYPWNFELPGKGSFKVDDEMVEALKAGRDKLAEHGWLNWFSCQPQVNTCIPKIGEYCASSESSCAAYINTIIGARTNRESPINTVYAAYTGCLPKYGSHLDENRAAKCIVELDDETRDNMQGAADWAALGACHRRKGGEPDSGRAQPAQEVGPDGDQADRFRLLPRNERPDYAPDGLYAGVPDAGGRLQGQHAEEPRAVHDHHGRCRRDVPPYQRHRAGARPGQCETGGHRHLRLSARYL